MTTMTLGINLWHGDSREILPVFNENYFDSMVTDPPYETGFMGAAWDRTGIAYDTEFWKLCMRAGLHGAHVLVFGGTKTWHRVAVGIEDAGFEIRDTIMCWTYGTGYPKASGLLKPACEPIIVARKPITEGTIAANVRKWGVGRLNVEACRTASGRYPANSLYICLCEGEHEPGCQVRELGEQSGESRSTKLNCTQVARGAKSKGAEKERIRIDEGYEDSGDASRFFYIAKPSKKERGEGNVHLTVKPIELMRYLLRLVTPPGGKSLDPFLGSGTTAIAAELEAFSLIGIEKDKASFDTASRRISAYREENAIGQGI